MAYNMKPCTSLSEKERRSLSDRMAQFYLSPPPSYYALAETQDDQYNWASLPFHCHLLTMIEPNNKVLEVGCGTAHLCPHVERRGAIYHGMDFGTNLLQENRSRFPHAFFFPIHCGPDMMFDLVASLYTIEHIAEPIAYLEQLWQYCRPGGKIAIICPDFIDGDGFPTSLYFGKTPRRFREKLMSFSFLDAILHLVDIVFVFPLWKRKARKMPAGAFWINTEPRELLRKDHVVDGDAVHFPRLNDLEDYFTRKGATIIASAKTLPEVAPAIRKHNTYLMVEKPQSDCGT
jgi:SAM-dependent methyltransferase